MIKATIFLTTFLLILSHQAHAQSNLWDEFFKKPFVPENTIPGKDKNTGKVLSKNIKHQQQEIFTLRIQGKSEAEIIKILNSGLEIYGTGSISGTVFKNDGVTPIDDFIIVSCYDEYGQFSGSGYATSYYNGVYKIENLAAGSYYVRTSAYNLYKNKYYNNADNWQSAELVNVANGEAVTGKNFSLSRNTGSVSGYVKNKNNEVLTDVSIFINDTEYLANGSAQTDSEGFYEVEGLASGNYRVLADYRGDQNYCRSWYDNSSTEEEATLVPVNEPYATTNINFFLDLGGAVSGTVLKPDNEPAGEYSCKIIIVDENDNAINQTYVHNNGEYLIKSLPAGQYKLKLYYNFEDNYLDKWYGESYSFESAAFITVTPPDTLKNIDFRLTPGGAISGNMMDSFNQPVPETFSVLAYKENSNPAADFFDGYGYYNGTNYIISKLPPGKYKLQIEPYTYASQWFNNKNSFGNADLIVVNGSDTIHNINFTLDKGGTIAGTVTSKTGQPIYDGRVEVYDLNKNWVKDGNVNNIHYFIEGIPPGYYKLLYRSNTSEYEDQWYNGKHSFETATTVMAVSGQQTPAIFSIGYTGSIAGFVFDNNNKRIDGEVKLIDALLYDAATGEYIDGSQISFNGGYKISSFFNTYKLAIVNYYFNSLPYQDSLAVFYYGGGKSFNDPNTEIITFAYETTQQLDDIKMETAPGSVSGSVFLKNDLFTKGVYEILCFDEEGYLVKAIVHFEMYGMDGHYKINGIRPGTYYLLIAANIPNGVPGAQWYDAVGYQLDQLGINPRMIIPAGVQGIVVGNGETSGIDFHFDSFSSTGEDISVTTFSLKQNYPNPFNSSSVIKYSVAEHSHVTIEIFNTLGEKLGTILNEEKSPGTYEVTWHAVNLPSGVYFYRLRADSFVETKKMVLMK